MKTFIFLIATLYITPSLACINISYNELTCYETIDSSDNFYPLGNVVFEPTKMIFLKRNGSTEIPIPSTQTDPSGWSTNYECINENLIIQDDYLNVQSSQTISFHKNSFSYEGTTLIQNHVCDDNGNCKNDGVKAVKIVGACE